MRGRRALVTIVVGGVALLGLGLAIFSPSAGKRLPEDAVRLAAQSRGPAMYPSFRDVGYLSRPETIWRPYQFTDNSGSAWGAALPDGRALMLNPDAAADENEAYREPGEAKPPTLWLASADFDERVALIDAPETVASGRLLGVSPDGRAVFVDARLPFVNGPGRRLNCLRFGVDERGAAAQSTPITLPENAALVEDAALSPDGRTIAWTLTVRRDWPGVPLLRAHTPSIGNRFPLRLACELWLSDASGANFRLIGGRPIGEKLRLETVGWLDHGQKLAFFIGKDGYAIAP